MKNTKSRKSNYKKPQLKVYGKVTALTAAGTIGTDECGNNGKKKGCSTRS